MTAASERFLMIKHQLKMFLMKSKPNLWFEFSYGHFCIAIFLNLFWEELKNVKLAGTPFAFAELLKCWKEVEQIWLLLVKNTRKIWNISFLTRNPPKMWEKGLFLNWNNLSRTRIVLLGHRNIHNIHAGYFITTSPGRFHIFGARSNNAIPLPRIRHSVRPSSSSSSSVRHKNDGPLLF